jgi:hypothetical protein
MKQVPFDCDAAAQALDSVSYYEVIDGNIPANINLILRYRCKLANARGQHARKRI